MKEIDGFLIPAPGELTKSQYADLFYEVNKLRFDDYYRKKISTVSKKMTATKKTNEIRLDMSTKATSAREYIRTQFIPILINIPHFEKAATSMVEAQFASPEYRHKLACIQGLKNVGIYEQFVRLVGEEPVVEKLEYLYDGVY